MSNIFTFEPVRRQGSHVIISAFSESGCGKTLSLLRLGRGLVGPEGKLAILDTENGRGRIYEKSVTGGYLYAELTPPFTPERYIEAIEAAESAGVQALLIDSATHEWDGLGGILEVAEDGKSNSGQPLQGLVKWAKPKARHKKYVQRLLDTPMHLLISLRAKEKMVQLVRGDVIPEGKKVGDIISDGYVPIQDKRFIYETTVQLFFPTKGERGVPVTEQGPLFKCPEDLLSAFPSGQRITEDTGRLIAEWVAGGVPVDREFEALRHQAEEVAANGNAALDKWVAGLPRAKKAKLVAIGGNLRSIAADADRSAAEHETTSTSDGPLDRALDAARGDERAGASRDAAPGRLSPSHPAATRIGIADLDPNWNSPAGTDQPIAQSGDNQKGQSASVDGIDKTPSPAGGTACPLSDAAAPAALNQTPIAHVGNRARASTTDLLGDPPAENLWVPLPPTDKRENADWAYYGNQVLAAIAEDPKNGPRAARISRTNEGGLHELKTHDEALYQEVMRAITDARRA